MCIRDRRHFLAGVYGKGHTFFENLLPNSLPLHTRVFENTTLFSDPICKGNVPLWEWCGLVEIKKIGLEIISFEIPLIQV